MPSFFRRVDVSFIVLQSDSLPITTPTRGDALLDFLDFMFSQGFRKHCGHPIFANQKKL